VILDVVYNHLGSVGEKLLRPFGDAYFSQRHKTDWGSPLNFDDDDNGPVREFILANVRYWIEEFHLDGYRVDATQALHDDSRPHILLEIAHAARLATDRRVLILGENEPQRAELLRSAAHGGCEMDSLWNDDFHHSAMVRLTGKREAYYTDYRGSAEELLSLVRWGFLYQGQRYAWQDNPRGTPALDIEATRFVNFVQNHDQVANTLDGARIHALSSPGCYRAMAALWLLAPQSPMFFQGQEFAASSPFLYFNDCAADQADSVRKGRAGFLAQFPSLASVEVQAQLVDPCARQSYERSQLDHAQRQLHRTVFDLHRDLLALRRDDPVLSQHRAEQLHGVALSPDALLIRYLPPGHGTRILLVNFGSDLKLESVSSPLAAPPAGCQWQILWSSDDPRYGGHGTPPVDTPQGWHVPGQAAVILHPVPGSFAT
jgi:maltooligosyltrehalose trehalohydrolase